MKMETRTWRLIIALSGFLMLFGVIFPTISFFGAISGNKEIATGTVYFQNFLKFCVWVALAPIIFFISKKFSFDKFTNYRRFLRTFSIHIPLGFVFSLIHSLFYIGIICLVSPNYGEKYMTFWQGLREFIFLGSFYLNLLVYALIVIIVQAYLIYSRYLAEETRNLQLQEKLASAQLQALKMQLQPHFLFNTLHSISSLNLSNPTKANAMITRLGDFLRMTLERSDEQLVTLNEELEFLRCYLEIEQIRFSDRLTVEFDVADETLAAQVPHLILQPIVENAVKHGIAPHAAKSKITISANKTNGNLFLKVEDRTAKKNKAISTNINGKGLSNVRLRLEHLYGANSNLRLTETANGLTAELKIPFSDIKN